MVGRRWRLGGLADRLCAAKAQGNTRALVALEKQIHAMLSEEAHHAHANSSLFTSMGTLLAAGSTLFGDLFVLREFLVKEHPNAIDVLIERWYQQEPEDEEDGWASAILLLLCSHRTSCRWLLQRPNGFLDHCLEFTRTVKQPQRAKSCLHQILEFAVQDKDGHHADVIEIRHIVRHRVEVIEVLLLKWPLDESFEFVLPLMVQLLVVGDSRDDQQNGHHVKQRLASNPRLGTWLQEFFLWQRDPTQMAHFALQIVQELMQEPWSVLQMDHAQMVFQSIEQCASVYAHDSTITSTCQEILLVWSAHQSKASPMVSSGIPTISSQAETISLPTLVQRLGEGDLDSKRKCAREVQQLLIQSSGIMSVVGGDMIKLGILNHLISFAQATESHDDHCVVEDLLKSLASDSTIALTIVQQKEFVDDLIQLTMHADYTPMLARVWVWSCLNCLSRHQSEDVVNALVDSDAVETLLIWSQAIENKKSSFWCDSCGILQNLCRHGDEQLRFQLIDKGGFLLAVEMLESDDPSIHHQALSVLHDLTLTRHEAVHHHLSTRLPKVQSFTASSDDKVRTMAGKVLQRANSVMVDDATKMRHLVKTLLEGESNEVLEAEKSIYAMLTTDHEFTERNTKLVIKDGGVPLLVSKWPDPFAVKTLYKLCESLSTCDEFVNVTFVKDMLRLYRHDQERAAADVCLRLILEHADDNSTVYRMITRVDVLEHMIQEWPFETIYLRVLPMLRALIDQKNPRVKRKLSSSPAVAECLLKFLNWPLNKTRPTEMVVSALKLLGSLVEDPSSLAHEPHGVTVLKSIKEFACKNGQDRRAIKHCEHVQRLFESTAQQNPDLRPRAAVKELPFSPIAKRSPAPQKHPQDRQSLEDGLAGVPISLSKLVEQLDQGDFALKRHSIKLMHQYCESSSQNRLEVVNVGALTSLISFAQVTDAKDDQHLVGELMSLLACDSSVAQAMAMKHNFLNDLIGLTQRANTVLSGWVWRCLNCLSNYEFQEIQHALIESRLLEAIASLSKRSKNLGANKALWHDGCDILQNLLDHSDDQTRARLAASGARSFAFETLDHQDVNIQQKGIRLLRVLTEVRSIEAVSPSHGHVTLTDTSHMASACDSTSKVAQEQHAEQSNSITVHGQVYQLKSFADDGARSTLYKAQSVSSLFSNTVLMKIYRPESRAQALKEKCILQELMLLRDGDKFVVYCLDFSENEVFNGRHCSVLVMEFGKQSLKQMVSQADMASDILPTMQKVAECLRFLHVEAQVVHGAVELHNIVNFGDGFPRLKLIGFEGACHVNEQMVLHCNPEYCPPELARQIVKDLDGPAKLLVGKSTGCVEADTSFDVWCFGVLWIKCLLRGKALVEFRGMNSAQILNRIAKPDFNFDRTLNLLNVSRATKVAIKQCVRRDPQLRWTMQDIIKSHVIRGFSTTLMNANDLQAKLVRMEETMQHMMEQHSQIILEAMESTLPTTWLLVPWRDQGANETEPSRASWLWSLIQPEHDLELKMLCDAVFEEEGLRSKEPCSGCPEDQRIRIKAASPFVVKALPLLRCASALLKIANLSCLVMGLPAFSFVESFLTNVCGAGDLLEMMKQVLAAGFDQDAMVGMITENLDSMVDLAEKDFDDHVEQKEDMIQKLQEGSRQIRALCQSPEKQQLMRDLLNHVDPQKKWTEQRIVGGLQKRCVNGTVRWLCAHHAEQLNPSVGSAEQKMVSNLHTTSLQQASSESLEVRKTSQQAASRAA